MKKFEFTKGIYKIVDCELKDILVKKKDVDSFNNCLDRILKKLNIEIQETPSKNELAVRCNQNNDEGYMKTIFIWFYLRKLEAMGYICFVETAAKSSQIELGYSKGTQNGYLPKDVSDFIVSHITSNIVVSPELMEYVKAGHISRELYEAKKSSCVAVISVILVGISALASIIMEC